MRKSSNSYGPKKTLFITLASTLLFSLLLLASHELPNSVYANTYPNLFPGVGIATIDGFIDPAEWANADSVSFTTEGPAEITGTFYVMQSNTMLYLGVSLADDELNQEYWYGLYGDTIFFDFDDDNSGSLYEIGENRFVSYAYSPWFSDDFFHTDNSAGFSSPDTSQPGGVNNGDARQPEIVISTCMRSHTRSAVEIPTISACILLILLGCVSNTMTFIVRVIRYLP